MRTTLSLSQRTICRQCISNRKNRRSVLICSPHNSRGAQCTFAQWLEDKLILKWHQRAASTWAQGWEEETSVFARCSVPDRPPRCSEPPWPLAFQGNSAMWKSAPFPNRSCLHSLDKIWWAKLWELCRKQACSWEWLLWESADVHHCQNLSRGGQGGGRRV